MPSEGMMKYDVTRQIGHERNVVVGAPVPPLHSRMHSKQNGWSQWPNSKNK
jgi:hypothetical protein